jgi:DNA-binding FadR family transcriptional regulator
MQRDSAEIVHWRKGDILLDLERRVLEGEFPIGSKLPPERDLVVHYSVSRPVVREAIAGLVERRLLEVHPGRGTFVRAVGVDHLAEPLTRAATRSGVTPRDVVTARLMIEGTGAELAASRVGESGAEPPAEPGGDVATVLARLEEHEAARTLEDRARTDLAFHEAVAAASGNPLVALMFGAIRTQVHALMLRSHSDRTVRRLGEPLHREIAEAIRAGRPRVARGAMDEHIQLALELYGDDLDRPLSEIVPATPHLPPTSLFGR